MLETLIDQLLDRFPVRAGSFIVTLYGDVVAPRAGEIWMGNIIEACKTVHIGESRVRTAVSRLVSSGRIKGEKEGRKSYYRLTGVANDEFSRAARLIYRRPNVARLQGWHLVLLPHGAERDALLHRLTDLRFGMALPHLAILPDRGEPLPPLGAPHFRATTEDDLTEIARGAWGLDELAEQVDRFVDGFAELEDVRCTPQEALGLRLLLVHMFRQIALADPMLPVPLLPKGWKGPEARNLFARLYLQLSPGADAAIAKTFVNRDGPLVADPTRIARRIADLSYS
ncbi:PaaX family transcriptional regulator C-terminal domain-containing protein [Breoghania sp.]|uniref:PaaX family transcriptional regulator C-terminal domain-containing protein n=1 Tax=Breoghania sp. TaxID=2065378 RepID=UPI002AAB6F2C|nr:PaaX family transcriptional regulator C-terminal domain-containing protein [Breoghania sp.]